LSLAEVDAIAAGAEKYGKVVAEAFMYRTHPQTLKAQELVASGKLGKIRMVRGSYTYLGTDPDNYRWKPEMGGGCLWDVGCYPLSYTRALLGTEPQGVFGFQVTGPTCVDEFFAGQLHFPNDIYAEFDCSVKIPYHVFMEIVGEEATLIIPRPFSPGAKEKLFLARGGKTEVIAVKGTEPYVGEVEDMVNAILLGQPPILLPSWRCSSQRRRENWSPLNHNSCSLFVTGMRVLVCAFWRALIFQPYIAPSELEQLFGP
jgi:xylose dehydrogenase (NAD/NADP)